MRILQISSARNFGGGERHFVDLCHGMQARGHDVFAALRPTNQWQDRLNLPAERILHVSLRNALGVLSAQRIAEFVKENEIEIVHAHAARDYIPASIVCRLAKDAKFVLTRHVLFPLKPFHRFALNNLSRAIAVSAAVEVNLRRIFPPDKIALIYNGIAIENWAAPGSAKNPRAEFRSLHEIPPDAFLIGTMGELIELKGQRDFVLAAKIIAEKFAGARFVIVGKDNSVNQSFRRELKRLVKVFNLENQFLWLDWVEDTAEFFRALDIFVSPSHSESFGLAILEAMASGAAIVATETEGACELIEDNVTGKLVPLKAPVELAEAVNALLPDEISRKIFGSKARASAAEKFSLERMITETESVYKEL